MKIVELTNYIQLPLSNEEADLLSKFNEDEKILKSALTEREQHLVSQLVNKGVVIRKNDNGSIGYFKHVSR